MTVTTGSAKEIAINELSRRVAELEAEHKELLRQLLQARQHNEYMLAVLASTYNKVRNEQTKDLKEAAKNGLPDHIVRGKFPGA